MNKVKSNSGEGKKIAPSTESLKSEQKDKINLEEKIDKLTIKTNNVNGLLNGVEHNLSSKLTKKNRKNNKAANKNVDSQEKKEDKSTVVSFTLDAINNTNVANEEDTSLHRLESVPSTSDITKKCDQSDLKLTKGKSKSKRTDFEKPGSSSSSSTKSEGKGKTDELDPSSDFDITAYIKAKYGSDNKKEDMELEKDAQHERAIEAGVDKVEDVAESAVVDNLKIENPKIEYVQYESELQMPMIMKIIQKDLSEPYSIYTYRYFIHNWPNLCFLVSCFLLCLV